MNDCEKTSTVHFVRPLTVRYTISAPNLRVIFSGYKWPENMNLKDLKNKHLSFLHIDGPAISQCIIYNVDVIITQDMIMFISTRPAEYVTDFLDHTITTMTQGNMRSTIPQIIYGCGEQIIAISHNKYTTLNDFYDRSVHEMSLLSSREPLYVISI